jgi:protein phosphatase
MQALAHGTDSPRDVTGVGAAEPNRSGVSVLRAFGVSDKGRTRPINEDCFAVEDDLQLCLVADGLGGRRGGEVASRVAVEAVTDFVRERVRPSEPAADPWPLGYDRSLSDNGNLLRTAIQLASLRILEAAATSTGLAGMCTTIVAALLEGPRLSVAHVGDSRLYLAGGGRLRLLTEDDSWMATILAREPAADPALLRRHPMRSALTNVLGSRVGTDVHVVEQTLAGGELLLLTTDGVHGSLEDGELLQLVFGGAHNSDPQWLAGRLVSAALERGSRDNCTAVVARYDRE